MVSLKWRLTCRPSQWGRRYRNWERKRKNRLHIWHSPSYLAVIELPPQDTPDSPHTWCDCSVVGEGVRV